MNILLSGIPLNDRDSLRKQIEDIILTIFKDGICNVTEINVPEDFKSTVNSIHKEKYPDQLYFLEGRKPNLGGKTFNYENDIRVILNKELSYEYIIVTLYHELMHAKYYHEIEGYNYLKYHYNDVVEETSFNFIDEYHAYKETFLKYPKVLKEYEYIIDESVDLFSRLGESNFVSNQRTVFKLFEINDFDSYMYNIKVKLSILISFIDVYEQLYDKIFEDYLIENYDGSEMFYIMQYLHIFVNSINNNIPEEHEFRELKKCFNSIAWFYDIYCDNKK